MKTKLPTETETMKRVIKVAKQGDGGCQLQLAETYMLGAVCKQDLGKAVYWMNQFFITTHANSKAVGDTETMNFAKDVLATYDKHGVNGHIVWKPGNQSSKR